MNNNQFKIIVDGWGHDYPKGTTAEDIAIDLIPRAKEHTALCVYNGKLCELTTEITEDGEIWFEDMSSANGMRTYKRSAIFLMQKALDDIFGEKPYHLRVMYSISSGYYCMLDSDIKIDQALLDKIESKMTELSNQDIPIKKTAIRTEEAKKIFGEMGMADKEKLLTYRNDTNTNVYDLGGTKDYFYGYMLPSTGYITRFKLHQFDDGFVLQFPTHRDTERVAEFNPPKRLFKVLKDSRNWSKTMNVPSVGALNDVIASGNIRDLILMQEALMEGQISNIAEDIASRPGVKFIMIAGPSSSGKTTFSHRLSTQLRAKGLFPHPVPLDDYYFNRDQIPVDEYGEKDYECIEGLDIERFNEDMLSLLSGKNTELPIYDFTVGSRKSRGRMLQLKTDDVLVIEGIHGLNDKLSYSLPIESKYKIYISALSMLAIDEHNPMSTSEGRLLRRIIRDARTRNTCAKDTIAMWPSVKRGERKNIFPFQESADTMFNTALIYELAVMKVYAEPQLYAIKPGDPEYAEAKKLIKFLQYVLPMPTEDIPNNSLMREFIGGSCYKV